MYRLHCCYVKSVVVFIKLYVYNLQSHAGNSTECNMSWIAQLLVEQLQTRLYVPQITAQISPVVIDCFVGTAIVIVICK